MIKKGLAVAVILLFIGVAFAIPINANVSKSSLEPVTAIEVLEEDNAEKTSDEDCGCNDDIKWNFSITCLILKILFWFIASNSPFPVPLMCQVIMIISDILGCPNMP